MCGQVLFLEQLKIRKDSPGLKTLTNSFLSKELNLYSLYSLIIVNRTLKLTEEDRERLRKKLTSPDNPQGTFCGNYKDILPHIPKQSIDLLFLDPPYNMDKSFKGLKFSKTDTETYQKWLEEIIISLKPTLKNTASIYICGDWYSSTSIHCAAQKHFIVRNRITWEREKGRGAKSNWKNASEDIWFCTMSNDYYFNVEKVKLRRKVLAPYKKDGVARDWKEEGGNKYRDTFPSNLWNDITIPFWSMRENTEHPTQKSEKLLAKIILASSKENDMILDPFLGSGTTSVVAKKLNRRYLGIDVNEEYCLLCEKRLENKENTIQGYVNGIFFERNSTY